MDPKFQGAGIATKLLNFAEQFGKENNYSAIRLDSFTENKGACRLYEKRGYEKRGFVTYRKGDFICFEKKL
ncbi:GNAT family N-acetyltransferase [Caldifermentibacillus hisashii]|uniref:GNAT family N-acetyltransferase n=1 Tax=Caldifermentibacillus hisashii TaxID=996558 RepID=UPI003BEF4882